MSRSPISMSAIKALAAHQRAKEREMERLELIDLYANTTNELPIQYELLNVDFDVNTRLTKIKIEQIKTYRTIVRYVTKDYVRYPVYSDWKTKSKIINKSIKLTNQALESLYRNDDMLISRFAEDIVSALNNEDLLPSWYIDRYLRKQHDAKIKSINAEKERTQQKAKDKISELEKKISEKNSEKETLIVPLNRSIKKEKKTSKKIEKIENAKGISPLDFFTLFIRILLVSNSRKKRLQKKLFKIQSKISRLSSNIDSITSEISANEEKINAIREEEKKNLKSIEAALHSADRQLISKLKKIEPLPVAFSIVEDTEGDPEFIPLKSFVGLDYVKIVGCYAIHNRENDKYYVGQSKDVVKRIKQHFKGTLPSNIIFAEDYYSSKFPNKEDLFEVKIMKCQTKDELDSTEKKLIEVYDSYKNGYNKTAGNT